jgi:hypothetical protein
VQADYDYRRGDSLKYGINAGFISGRDRTEEQTLTDYFPTEVYEIRRVESQSNALTKNNTYNLGGLFTHARQTHMLQARITGSYGTQSNLGTNRMTDRTDGNVLSQLRQSLSDRDSKTLEASVSYSLGLKNDAFITTSVSGSPMPGRLDGRYARNDEFQDELAQRRRRLRLECEGTIRLYKGCFGILVDRPAV